MEDISSSESWGLLIFFSVVLPGAIAPIAATADVANAACCGLIGGRVRGFGSL